MGDTWALQKEPSVPGTGIEAAPAKPGGSLIWIRFKGLGRNRGETNGVGDAERAAEKEEPDHG